MQFNYISNEEVSYQNFDHFLRGHSGWFFPWTHRLGRYTIYTTFVWTLLSVIVNFSNFSFYPALVYCPNWSCKAQGITPKEWLNDVIAKLPYYPEKDFGKNVRELFPEVWKLEKSNTNTIGIFYLWKIQCVLFGCLFFCSWFHNSCRNRLK